jgi:hypothetical protein
MQTHPLPVRPPVVIAPGNHAVPSLVPSQSTRAMDSRSGSMDSRSGTRDSRSGTRASHHHHPPPPIQHHRHLKLPWHCIPLAIVPHPHPRRHVAARARAARRDSAPRRHPRAPRRWRCGTQTQRAASPSRPKARAAGKQEPCAYNCVQACVLEGAEVRRQV